MAARPVRRGALLLLLLIGAQAQAGARTAIIDVAVGCASSAVRHRQLHRHKRCHMARQKVLSLGPEGVVAKQLLYIAPCRYEPSGLHFARGSIFQLQRFLASTRQMIWMNMSLTLMTVLKPNLEPRR